jgi:acyl-CoA thioester hydrolase
MEPFALEIVVPTSAIDGLGHVNNVEYVRWMQDVATAHADESGCTAATATDGAVWVVRSHHIEYLRPAFAGEKIRIRTWVADVRRAFSLRRYEFLRAGDDTLLATAETDWVYLDRASGRPKSIPGQIRALLDLAIDG